MEINNCAQEQHGNNNDSSKCNQIWKKSFGIVIIKQEHFIFNNIINVFAVN